MPLFYKGEKVPVGKYEASVYCSEKFKGLRSLNIEYRLLSGNLCFNNSLCRLIHSMKFSATIGDQLEYNGSQGASGSD